MGGSVSQKAGHFTNGCEPLFSFRHNALELALLYVRRQDIRTFEGKHSDKRPNVQRLRAASPQHSASQRARVSWPLKDIPVIVVKMF